MKNEIQLESRITEFGKAISAGIEGIVRAAEIYVEAIDEDPACADRFRDAFADWIPSAAWTKLAMAGAIAEANDLETTPAIHQ